MTDDVLNYIPPSDWDPYAGYTYDEDDNFIPPRPTSESVYALAEPTTITLDPTPATVEISEEISVDPRLDKLASLIEAGAKMRPQSFAGLFSRKGNVFTSCAIGAADEALGLDPDLFYGDYDIDFYAKPFLVCGLTCNPRITRGHIYSTCLLDEILYLNDTAYWAREAIAAHIRTLTLED